MTKKNIQNKSGSITIMVMIFFIGLLTLIFAFINASSEIAIKSTCESFGKVWGRSILAEFDLNLQGRYGIFAFRGFEGEIDKKLDYYASNSFNQKDYIEFKGCNSYLASYSMLNLDIFKDQIIALGKIVKIKDALNKSESDDNKTYKPVDNKIINNQKILNSLPSSGIKTSISINNVAEIIKKGFSIKEIFNQSSNAYYENQYISSYFNDYLDVKKPEISYFNNEIEYIICGKTSDAANRDSVKSKLLLLRNALNFSYLLTDKKRRSAAMAAAEIIAPGPAAIAAELIIIEGWALLESRNDLKLLLAGKKVPLLKNNETWATDIDMYLKNKSKGIIDSKASDGINYKGYLSILTYFLDENTKLLRTMDLIQINMKYLYYEDFLIKEYNYGLEFDMKVNRKIYEFKETY